MDSMVNKYTRCSPLATTMMRILQMVRQDCAPTIRAIVYTKILKELFPDVPVVLGGIEASLRRVSHYDYWQDKLMKCILCDSGADLITYGMGEKVVLAVADALADCQPIESIKDIPQTVFLCDEKDIPNGITDKDIVLHSHEECLRNKKAQADNFPTR